MTDWDSNFYRMPLIEFLKTHLAKEAYKPVNKPEKREFFRSGNMNLVDVKHDGISC